MPSLYGMLLICYALCKLLIIEFLIHSHICFIKLPLYMEEHEISERVHNLLKITKLVSSGTQI